MTHIRKKKHTKKEQFEAARAGRLKREKERGAPKFVTKPLQPEKAEKPSVGRFPLAETRQIGAEEILAKTPLTERGAGFRDAAAQAQANLQRRESIQAANFTRREIAQTEQELAQKEFAQIEREEETRQFLEGQEFQKETLPGRVDLSTGRQPREGPAALPVFGAGAKAFVETFKLGAGSRRVDIPIIDSPETIRERALQEIQLEVIKQGSTGSEKFGAMIEAIPVLGTVAGRYLGGSFETPFGNVQTMMKEMESQRSFAEGLAEKIAGATLGEGIGAFNAIEDIEANIARLEQRIKIMSQESAILIANTDELSAIEDKIQRAKTQTFSAKQKAARALAAGPAPPTDSSIFLALQELQK